ncbi:MAG: FAD-dependent oxidoreductase [Blastocatellia bacterium]|nr:FAD-dependent oxidoreductase [Blastocatellia bacterium]
MSRLLILGAGIAGQTAALHARTRLGHSHEVVVVTPNSQWNWIPSNIWVGTGYMKPEQVTFPLAPVYRKLGIVFHQARAISIHPEGDAATRDPFVTIEYTSPERRGESERISYDYLINSTGPKLNFEATPGLGPEKNSLSVCTYSHADQTARALKACIDRMKQGEKQTLLIGTGHGNCTCQGAAFEYLFNVEFELRRQKVRDKARLVWLSNELELGDFGIGGMFLKRGGYVTHSRVFTESLYTERGIEWITQAHVAEVAPGESAYETLDGEERSIKHDFAMLLPPFSGVGLKAYDKKNAEITSTLFAPNGFMLVDGDYAKKPYEEWKPADWPETYQNPKYGNLFAVGIAFAPPHAISKPTISVKGTPIFPTPPRTGMPSGVMAREVARNIVDMMTGKETAPKRKASLARMGAACIASAGASGLKGTAVTMTLCPIVPDFEKYPDNGREEAYTSGEIGLAGHWIKHLLHYAFIYKAKANPFWRLVPE